MYWQVLGRPVCNIMGVMTCGFESVEDTSFVRHYEKALENVVNREY